MLLTYVIIGTRVTQKGGATLIGEKIQRLRDKRQMSQADLAAASGVGQSLLSKIEGGSRPNPTGDVLQKLAKTLGCTTDYLLGMHEEEDSESNPAAPALIGVNRCGSVPG